MKEKIVITGLGAVTPSGSSRAEILGNLRAGQTGLREVDIHGGMRLFFGRVDGREDVSEDIEFLPAEKRAVAAGEEGLGFALAATAAAMKEAGLNVDPRNRERIAVIVGSSKGNLKPLLRAHQRILQKSGSLHAENRELAAAFEFYPGSYVGTLIARRHGIHGPVLNYPAACATGVNCIIAAANLIRDGVADFAIAGSCESACNALTLSSFQNMGALARTRMRPFHRDRDGFNAGEGAGVFVLETAQSARRRGARILATLAGWDFRSDAHHMTAVEESGATIDFAIRRTLEQAKWDPRDVQYINAHGTGTPMNDRTEAKVIRRIFGAEGPPVSSLKGHIGHLLGASGAAELALAMIALEQSFVPPTLLLDHPDPEMELRFVRAGGESAEVSRFLKLSYGFGGHIGVLAVELNAEANA